MKQLIFNAKTREVTEIEVVDTELPVVMAEPTTDGVLDELIVTLVDKGGAVLMAGLAEKLKSLGIEEKALENLAKREQAKADAAALKAGEPNSKSIAGLLKRVEAIEKILGT